MIPAYHKKHLMGEKNIVANISGQPYNIDGYRSSRRLNFTDSSILFSVSGGIYGVFK